jgi:hypothetical protein
MDWSDEHYVKLYTRDSLTWKTWHWEARTVFLHLVRKVSSAGFIEVGDMEPASALALQLDLPLQVVAPGLGQLLACGTAELVDRAVLLPKFNEAQEARKSDAQKKRDERARTIARRRAAQTTEITKPHVTEKATVSPPVTQTDPPSPAQPSPAQPKNTAAAEKPQPRLRPLQEWLEQIYASSPGRGRYKHGGAKDTLALKALLPVATDEEIARRWGQGLKATGWASCNTFAQLAAKWNDLAATSPPTKGALATSNADWTNRPKSFEEELSDGL